LLVASHVTFYDQIAVLIDLGFVFLENLGLGFAGEPLSGRYVESEVDFGVDFVDVLTTSAWKLEKSLLVGFYGGFNSNSPVLLLNVISILSIGIKPENKLDFCSFFFSASGAVEKH
jgi:hypothetical protein